MRDIVIVLIIFFIVIMTSIVIITDRNMPVKPPDSPCERRTEIWRVTAYCPCSACCGVYADGITASGAKAEGKLIAAPEEIPFGTWINIEGYGYAEVLDRGGSIKRKRLDLLFPTHQKALNWGVHYMEKKGDKFVEIDK